MNRKERLFRIMSGQTVDRPAVNFYEIDGLRQDPDNDDKYNIYNHPSWRPLIQLAVERTDRLVLTDAQAQYCGKMRSLLADEILKTTVKEEDGRRIFTYRIQAGNRILSSTAIREADIDTVWCTEHPVKDTEDLAAWIDLPEQELKGEAFVDDALGREAILGDSGAILLDTQDPLCLVASLMAMDVYTIIALTEQELFIRALEKAARFILWNTEVVSAALPGRIWRIYGPEYATPPYLPPFLFRQYVTPYVKEMCRIIKKYGGFPRVHCHGNIREILDDLVETGCMAIDPIEPAPQGNVSLEYVRRNYGGQLALFGNLEAADIENLGENEFRPKVRRALEEGTGGKGRGFVLMPSASPYGRLLSSKAMRNYEVILEELDQMF